MVHCINDKKEVKWKQEMRRKEIDLRKNNKLRKWKKNQLRTDDEQHGEYKVRREEDIEIRMWKENEKLTPRH